MESRFIVSQHTAKNGRPVVRVIDRATSETFLIGQEVAEYVVLAERTGAPPKVLHVAASLQDAMTYLTTRLAKGGQA